MKYQPWFWSLATLLLQRCSLLYGFKPATYANNILLWVGVQDCTWVLKSGCDFSCSRVQTSSKEWVQLQGKFLLNPKPAKAIAYLEGQPAGIDILVSSFLMRPATMSSPSPTPTIENPSFGLNILENNNLFDGLRGRYPLGSCSLNIGTGFHLTHFLQQHRNHLVSNNP